MKKIISRLYDRSGAVLFQAFAPLADIGSQSSKLGNLYSSNDLSAFVNGLFKFAIAVGAIGAVLRLGYAGYLYMGQADMWSHKGQAKEIIGDVVLGLLLLLSVWLILFQINPQILSLDALKRLPAVPAQPRSRAPAPTPAANSAPGLSPFEQSQAAPYQAP